MGQPRHAWAAGGVLHPAGTKADCAAPGHLSPVEFSLDDAIPVLRSTPVVLRAWLGDLPNAWTTSDEGPHSWSLYDIVGHLIHGERTDWIPRTELLLSYGSSRP